MEARGGSPRRRARLVATLLALSLAAAGMLAAPAGAAPATVSGTVTDGTDPVPGAFVALTGPVATYGTRAGGDGTFTFQAEAGAYDLTAQAPGYAAETVADVDNTGGAVTGLDVTLAASGTNFRSLPAYGGQIGALRRGGSPGEFYVSTSVIPQVFRTVDHGGTWSPATVAYDDATYGLDRTMNLMRGEHLATSGFPGEVAALIGTTVSYSRDFGVTWRDVAGSLATTDDGSNVKVYWAHGGAGSVLLVTTPDGGGSHWVADMAAGTPALTEMTTPYGSSSDLVAVAAGDAAPYVAVADGTTGDVAVYTLAAAAEPGAPVSTLAGVLADPDALLFGGASDGGTPPSFLGLLATAGDGTVAAAAKPAADAAFEAADLADATPLDDPGGGRNCRNGGLAPGTDVDPGADATGALFLVGSCALRAVPGSAIDADAYPGTNGQAVFGPAFDGASDAVVLGTDGARGVVKAAAFDTDPTGGFGPSFPDGQDASPGTGAGTGGVAVAGITVPVVKDVVLGPTAGDVAVVLSGSGGNLGLATDDGGTTFGVAVEKGGLSAAWWEGGDGHTWLAFGAGGAGNLLTVRQDWAPASDPLPGPNVETTDPSIAGGNVTALAPLPGADTLFFGAAVAGAGSVGRADLAGAGDAVTATVAASGSLAQAARALAYCPAGAAASVADTLFVGTGPDNGPGAGSLRRVDGASTAGDLDGVAVDVGLTTPVNDLAVDCARGTVWVGAGTSTDGGLYVSRDGGTTWSEVQPSPSPLNITTIALNPADGDELAVAANAEGYVFRSTTAGETWVNPNNPMAPGGRSFMSEGIRGLVLPPAGAGGGGGAAPGVVATVADPDPAVVGTGGGLLEGEVRAGSSAGVAGAYGARRAGAGWEDPAKVGGSSGGVAVAVDGNDRAHLVYATATGLYHRTRGASAPGWSPAAKIAGTRAGDLDPALDARGGTVALAFRRTGDGAGVYAALRGTGWSQPARVERGRSLRNPDVALDGDAHPHLTWHDGGGVGYARHHRGDWRVTARVPGSAGGSWAAIAAAAGAHPVVRVAYAGGGGIALATRGRDGDWSTRAVGGTRAGDTAPAIALDAGGAVHLAHRRPAGAGTGIWYRTNRGGGWQATRVSTAGGDRDPAVAATTAASPATPLVHVAFARASTGVYAARTVQGALGAAGLASWAPGAAGTAVAVERDGGRVYLGYTRA